LIVTLLNQEVVSMFPIDLGFVSGLSHVLFLGVVLFLIGHVCAGHVILEVTDKFGVDTDQTGNDTHDVLGECTSLVGADDGSVGHSLAGPMNTDEELFSSHPFGSESEGESYCQRETFRNSDDDQCDGDDQDVGGGDTILAGSTERSRAP